MLVAARKIAGFLLLFVLVTGCLSTAYYLVQGGDDYADERCNLVVSKKKRSETTSGNKIGGRKMVYDHYDFMKMETMKEIGVRAKYIRKSRMLMSRDDFRARFVAFNADYKGPRHHPPKNN